MSSTPIILRRLNTQIHWYDEKSAKNKNWFYRLKVTEVCSAAFIPLLTKFEVSDTLIGAMGVLIVILEGIQALFQFQGKWTKYRSTCESLKHEKYLWVAKTGPYSGRNPDKILTNRMETLISREHAQWIESQDKNKDKNFI